MLFSAFFSMRLTCACEMPMAAATSICVLPRKNRRVRIRFSRSLSPAIAYLSESSSSHVLSSLLSPI